MTENRIIQIENLIFRYEDVPSSKGKAPAGGDADSESTALELPAAVIKGVDLDIEEGSFVAVIGRNGSGKSTLAKCINALLVPTEGDVFVDGMNTKNDDDVLMIRKTAAMVFQNPDNQIVSSIVEDDVAFGPENLGVEPERIRQLVDESLDAVKMGKYKNKGPHMLSGGQKQRIAIAGAIAMRPKCIVFDEPTAMLDPSGRKDVIDIIKDLNSQGITTVLITHYMEEAARADRVVIMDKGVVRMDGAPAEVFRREDELKAMDLDVPCAVKLASELRKLGVEIEEDIVDEEGLVEAICRLK